MDQAEEKRIQHIQRIVGSERLWDRKWAGKNFLKNDLDIEDTTQTG